MRQTIVFSIVLSIIQATVSRNDETTIYGEISTARLSFQMYDIGLPNKYFQAFTLNPNRDGFYNITSKSNLNLYGYLYNNSFNPTDPIENLIVEDDDSGEDYQFLFDVFLEANNTFILVVTTTYEMETGNFSIEINGPLGISFVDFVPNVITTTQSQSTASLSIQRFSLYGLLSSISTVFARPNQPQAIYYSQIYKLLIQHSGVYTFNSEAKNETCGYLYNDLFDSSSTTSHLIANGDNDSINGQFRFSVHLTSGQTYILVVSKCSNRAMGSFIIRGNGPSIPSVTIYRLDLSSTTSTESTTVATNSTEISFSGILHTNNALFNSYSTIFTPYSEAYVISVPICGNYTLTGESNIFIQGYLYENEYDPHALTTNLIDADGTKTYSSKFHLEQYLSSDKLYILIIVTKRLGETGNFTVKVSGPTNISVSNFKPTTIRPRTTSSTSRPEPTIVRHDGFLSSTQYFSRPRGSGSFYYFEAFNITTRDTAYAHIFTTSSLDTYGCLYEANFNPSYPYNNLFICNDDSDSDNQFFIETTFRTGSSYILVVTTLSKRVSGNYALLLVSNSTLTVRVYTPSKPGQTGSTLENFVDSSELDAAAVVGIALGASLLFILVILVTLLGVSKLYKNSTVASSNQIQRTPNIRYTNHQPQVTFTNNTSQYEHWQHKPRMPQQNPVFAHQGANQSYLTQF